MFAKHISNKGHVPKIYEAFLKFNSKKTIQLKTSKRLKTPQQRSYIDGK